MDVIPHMIRAVIQDRLMAQRVPGRCVVIRQTCARVVVMAQKRRVPGRGVIQVMVLQTLALQSLVVRSQCLGAVMLQKLRSLMRRQTGGTHLAGVVILQELRPVLLRVAQDG